MKKVLLCRVVRQIGVVSIISVLAISCTPTPMTHWSIQAPLQKAAIIREIGGNQADDDFSEEGIPLGLLHVLTATTELHQAAAKGDVLTIDESIKKGIPIDVLDSEGNTPLHLAHYFAQEEAIQKLVNYGSDPNILNKFGDAPLDMQRIARAEHIVEVMVNSKDTGEQLDLTVGQQIGLEGMDGAIVTKAIVLKVSRSENCTNSSILLARYRTPYFWRMNENCRNLILLAVNLRIPGSEQSLNGLLLAYGDKSLAEDYLNSGSDALRQGALQWAKRHLKYFRIGTAP